MKKSRAHHRSHHTSTPSAICLPPPKPPLTGPRKEPESERALRLPQLNEPLVVDTEGEAGGSYATRQARRRARRAETKAARRRDRMIEAEAAEIETASPLENETAYSPIEAPLQTAAGTSVEELLRMADAALGEPPAPLGAIPEPEPPPPAEPISAAQVLPEPAQPGPLPNSRALAPRPSGFLARLFGGWLVRRPAKLEISDPDALAEQMLILRTELALVQHRLDRIIAGSR